MFIRQLPPREKLKVYKRIKAILIEADALTYENLRNALDSRLKDLL